MSQEQDDTRLRRGAFGMIDALGFKGIWKSAAVSSVLHKLKALDVDLNRHMDKSFNNDPHYRRNIHEQQNMLEMVRATFLSDTIVVATALKPWWMVKEQMRRVYHPDTHAQIDELPDDFVDRGSESALVTKVGRYLSGALKLSALSEPVLSYRGAIAYGDFAMDDDGRFIVGPAVDESAEHHERAQGAFIYVAPSALTVLMQRTNFKRASLQAQGTG